MRGRDICVHGLSAAVLLSTRSPGIISLDTALNPAWLSCSPGLQLINPSRVPRQMEQIQHCSLLLTSGITCLCSTHCCCHLHLRHIWCCSCSLSWQHHWRYCKAHAHNSSWTRAGPVSHPNALPLHPLLREPGWGTSWELVQVPQSLLIRFLTAQFLKYRFYIGGLTKTACKLRNRHLLRSLGTITTLVCFRIWSSSNIVSN